MKSCKADILKRNATYNHRKIIRLCLIPTYRYFIVDLTQYFSSTFGYFLFSLKFRCEIYTNTCWNSDLSVFSVHIICQFIDCDFFLWISYLHLQFLQKYCYCCCCNFCCRNNFLSPCVLPTIYSTYPFVSTSLRRIRTISHAINFVILLDIH